MIYGQIVLWQQNMSKDQQGSFGNNLLTSANKKLKIACK